MKVERSSRMQPVTQDRPVPLERAQAAGKGRLLAAITVICLVQAALWLAHYHPSPKGLAGDETMYLTTAKQIAAGEESQLDPLWPPLYPSFLASLLLLDDDSLLVVQVVQLAILALSAFLLAALSRHILCPGTGANLSAIWLLAYPPVVAFAFYLWPEILHLGFLVGSFWIVVTRRQDVRWMPLLGLALGLAFLTKSLLGPFLPVLLVPVMMDRRPTRGLLRASLVLLSFFATLAPTIVSNHQKLGVPMVADSSLFNLWVGLNSEGFRGLEDNSSWLEYRAYRKSGKTFTERNSVLREKLRHFWSQESLATVLAQQLRRQPFRLWDRESYLTAQLPGGPLHGPNRGYRGKEGTYGKVLRWGSFLAYALLLATAAAGMVRFSPWRYPWLWLLLAFGAYNLLLFTFLQVNTRYRIQLLPVLFIYSGAFLGDLLERKGGPKRLLATLLAIATAWFLAFGGFLLEPEKASERTGFSTSAPFESAFDGIGCMPWPKF